MAVLIRKKVTPHKAGVTSSWQIQHASEILRKASCRILLCMTYWCYWQRKLGLSWWPELNKSIDVLEGILQGVMSLIHD